MSIVFIREPPKAKALHSFQDWHRAFHGTEKDYLKGILGVGEIVPAGEKQSTLFFISFVKQITFC